MGNDLFKQMIASGRNDDNKFISAHPVAAIMDADGLRKRLGNGFQKQIAVLMSKSVIDMLEIIQIHIQHGALAPCSLGLFNVFH